MGTCARRRRAKAKSKGKGEIGAPQARQGQKIKGKGELRAAGVPSKEMIQNGAPQARPKGKMT